MRTKLVVGFETQAMKLDETSFFSSILSLSAHWDYQNYDEYFGDKCIGLYSTDKIH